MADTSTPSVTLNRRRYGVFLAGLIVSALLIALLVIVLVVVLLIDNENATVVLIVLVLTLIIVGVAACIFMQWLHKKAVRRRDEGAKDWIQRTLSENQLHLASEPTPPPPPEPSAPSLTPRSSWVHWMPWKKSSPSSSGPPSYRAVSRNGGSTS